MKDANRAPRRRRLDDDVTEADASTVRLPPPPSIPRECRATEPPPRARGFAPVVDQVLVEIDGRDFELTSYRGGPIEVYSIEDGLATFRGYILALPAKMRARLVAAWASAHGVDGVEVAA